MVYCERCDRYFPHDRALWQHEEDSSKHYMCRTCNRDFTSWSSLEKHYVHSSRHSYCQLCDSHFDSDGDLDEHNYENHYASETDSDDGPWYCGPCDRYFLSESNLNAHLKSSLHTPRTVYCPGANCGRAFVSVSALMLHFEAGTCPSGLTRAELNRLVVRADRNNVITNPARLIGGPDGYAPPTVTTWATERSWNGDAYECFLCHRTFRMLRALNAHLQSPRHEEKVYRCPNLASCGTEFRTLSALTQHVESGKCRVNRFREVQDTYDSLVSGVRQLSIRNVN